MHAHLAAREIGMLPHSWRAGISNTSSEAIGAPLTHFGDEPVDPAYERFRDGWSAWIVKKAAYPGLRWSPAEGGGSWHVYALDGFDYIDFGVIGPKSPLAYQWLVSSDHLSHVWDWDGSFAAQQKLPDLWREVRSVYSRISETRPAAVWNPYDGSWRELRKRQSAPPPPPPGPPDPKRPEKTELEQRLDELLALRKGEIITDELFKQRALELLREYT